MTPQDRQLAEEIFQQAADLEGAARDSFLVKACGAHPGLRGEVESLLAGLEDTSFLQRPPQVLTSIQPLSSDVPDQLGNYRILTTLGAGGMGVVYEALQLHTQRSVALKVIRPHFASSAMLRRFEHEVWILGQLQHPGIAQIFEAGTFDSSTGPQPFFAMELIRGMPLREYAKSKEATVRSRLELIAQICDAVHHAHQKGVIHRDLKPGNILVDSTGQIKVLDFGVARVTDEDMRAVTVQTDIGQMIGTLPYMSPEQVTGQSSGLDIRTDVYSLGVMTYELLTGQLPLDLKDCSIAEAARRIRDCDPVPLVQTAPILRGDIDTIITKALSKSRDQRYQSAAEFAADIRRYLDDQPIVARPQTTLYHLAKFTKRNRGLVLGFSTGVLAITIAAVVSTLMLVQARKAREEEAAQRMAAQEAKQAAEQSSLEANTVKAFVLQDLLAGNSPEHVRHDITLTQAVKRGAQRIDERFADQPRTAMLLHDAVSDIFKLLGQGNNSLTHAVRAATLAREQYGDQSTEFFHYELRRIDRLADLGKWDDVLALISPLEPTIRSVLGPDHIESINVAAAHGDCLQVLGKYDQALPLLRDTYSRAKAVGFKGEALLRPLNALNACLRAMDQEDLSLRQEEYEKSIAYFGPQSTLGLISANNYALALLNANQAQEAGTFINQAISSLGERLPESHELLGQLYFNASGVYQKLADPPKAIGNATKALEIFTASRGESDAMTQRIRRGLVRLYIRNGQFPEALAMLQAAQDGRLALGEKHPMKDLEQLRAEILWVAAENNADASVIKPLLEKVAQDTSAQPTPTDGASMLFASARIWLDFHAGDLTKASADMAALRELAKQMPDSLRGIREWMSLCADRFDKAVSKARSGT